MARGIYRSTGGHQRLRGDLSPEDPLQRRSGRLRASKEVFLDLLEVEDRDQLGY
jgi:hypothetical protein